MDAKTMMDAINRKRIVRVFDRVCGEWGSAMAREDDTALDAYCAEIERRVEQFYLEDPGGCADRVIVYDNGVIDGATYVKVDWADRDGTMVALGRFLAAMSAAARERFHPEIDEARQRRIRAALATNPVVGLSRYDQETHTVVCERVGDIVHLPI